MPMSIIVPTSRPILSPGWDDAPVDRRRGRSARWRRLRAGAANTTRLAPGACCNCGGGGPSETCGHCSIPMTLFITDDAGTIAVVSAAPGANWIGCYQYSLGSNCTDPCHCLNLSGGGSGAGCVSVAYNVICIAGGNPFTFRVDRNWQYCSDPVTGVDHYCCTAFVGSPNCASVAVTCPGQGASTFQCSNVDQDTVTTTAGSCSPWPLSMTLTLGTTFQGLTSPLSAGITINP